MQIPPPIGKVITWLVDLYRSEDTVSHIHSGIAAATSEKFSTEPNPLKALKQAEEEMTGISLSPHDTTVLYINAAIGGGIEFVARGLLQNPIIKKVAEPQISHISQVVYQAADWEKAETGEAASQFLANETRQKKKTEKIIKKRTQEDPTIGPRLEQVLLADTPAGDEMLETIERMAIERYSRGTEDLTPQEDDDLNDEFARLHPDLFHRAIEESDENDRKAGFGSG